ncbi:MAG: tRNA glutamyl-Q(34) synthetase GluQRS [Hydrogenophilales bacterium]|nr:tRNA glutamyl-Q(34) synthetase GluQRS [Hydrogenophilales bacterium]
MTQALYRGRFAPSPTGPLHFGSLITALGSYLDAKSQGGEWWLRIDDLDPPRVAPGAIDAILRAMEAYGLAWDGAVQYQRQRGEAYAAALAGLQGLGVVYACACSRREIADSSIGRPGAPVYPGICRAGLAPGKIARALRVDTRGACVDFADRLQGAVMQDLEREAGDFIVQRADGLFAYQLAAVVDDAELGITDIVRGADLLDSTLRQVYLRRLLDLPLPRYLHLPVAVNALGEKLSKQTLAPPLDMAHPQPALVQALRFLNHAPPQALEGAETREILAWAVQNWSVARIPAVRSMEPQI